MVRTVSAAADVQLTTTMWNLTATPLTLLGAFAEQITTLCGNYVGPGY